MRMWEIRSNVKCVKWERCKIGKVGNKKRQKWEIKRMRNVRNDKN